MIKTEKNFHFNLIYSYFLVDFLLLSVCYWSVVGGHFIDITVGNCAHTRNRIFVLADSVWIFFHETIGTAMQTNENFKRVRFEALVQFHV